MKKSNSTTLAILLVLASCIKNNIAKSSKTRGPSHKNTLVTLDFDCQVVDELDGDKYDALIVVSEAITGWPVQVKPYATIIREAAKADTKVADGTVNVFFTNEKIKWMVFAHTGPVNRDYDDVRRYDDAVVKAVTRAHGSGKKNLLLVIPKSELFSEALTVSLLAAFETLYVPLEVREAFTGRVKAEKFGVLRTHKHADRILRDAVILEHGRIIARDIGGSDPERMAPPRVEDHIFKVFHNKKITINVTSGHDNFKRDFPLLAAVDRAANRIPRHRGRLIHLEYTGEGEIKNTYLFVGKGITYDTGGADVKAGGHMAGMHRDKCGAATITGLMASIAEFMPKGVKVVARLAFVRNSIGADAYVADEIVTSKAGVRVRVGNTDAEGRMVMADPLFHSRQQALNEVNPHLMTVATLTGHAVRAVGEGYSIILENKPAQKIKFAERIQEAGHELAEPFEISTLRREDFDFIAGRNEYEDILQANNDPSSATPRGHQYPAAFLTVSSGLDKHGGDSNKPLKYSHMDIAGSEGGFPGMPTGTPIVALAKIMDLIE